jgi:hypothetical protein
MGNEHVGGGSGEENDERGIWRARYQEALWRQRQRYATIRVDFSSQASSSSSSAPNATLVSTASAASAASAAASVRVVDSRVRAWRPATLPIDGFVRAPFNLRLRPLLDTVETLRETLQVGNTIWYFFSSNFQTFATQCWQRPANAEKLAPLLTLIEVHVSTVC